MNRSPEVEAFYKTRKWKKCRETFLMSRGGLCEACRRKGKTTPATEVHHIKRLTAENVNNPEIATNFQNLRALCEDCHKKEHNAKRWRCDAAGHVRI